MTQNKGPRLKLRGRKTFNKGSGHLSEMRVAQKFGAEQTAASGAMPGYKGDVKWKRLMIECKSTVTKSLGVKLEWLHKVAREARQEDETPALHINFVTEDGRPVKDGSWVMMRESDFRELIDSATQGEV